MTHLPSTTTILHSPWLSLARLAWWLLSAASLFIFILGGSKLVQEPLPNCSPGEAYCGPWQLSQADLEFAEQSGMPAQLMRSVYFLNSILPKVFFFIFGLLIFWRRSNDWLALLLSVMLTTFASEGITSLGNFTFVAAMVYAVATGAFLLLPFVFPDGQVVPGWMRRVMPVIVLVPVVASSVVYWDVDIDDSLFSVIMLVCYLVWFLFGGYSFLYRYRRVSNPTERQQTKWVMAGILGQIVLFIPFGITAVFYPPAQPSVERLAFFFLVYQPIGFISYLFMPASVAIAVLRYRLWDIDLIIRRTLQYTLLTGLLALVYFGSITILQSFFSSFSNQQSPFSIVLSTLAIAALFHPLRHRIQNFIDRRFYRQKYDAEKALAEFTSAARSETDLQLLSGKLVNVVQQTMQPTSTRLWLARKKSETP